MPGMRRIKNGIRLQLQRANLKNAGLMYSKACYSYLPNSIYKYIQLRLLLVFLAWHVLWSRPWSLCGFGCFGWFRRIRNMSLLSGSCSWTLTWFRRSAFCRLSRVVIWPPWEDCRSYSWWYREMVTSQLSDCQQHIPVLTCFFCQSILVSSLVGGSCLLTYCHTRFRDMVWPQSAWMCLVLLDGWFCLKSVFFATSLCGVLVFDCALPPLHPASPRLAPPLRRLPLVTTQLTHTQLVTTQLTHTQLTHTQLVPTQLTHTHTLSTHNLLTHNLLTHNTQLVTTQLTHTHLVHAQLAHTQLAHTQHTTCHHTTYSHTPCPHTTCPHTQLVHTQLTHTHHFAWQAWHLATWTCILRGRRGTWWHPRRKWVHLSQIRPYHTHTQLCHAQSFTAVLHATLSHTTLSNTTLSHTTFSHTSLSHTTLSPTTLSHTHTTLSHTTSSPTTLSHTTLSRTIFVTQLFCTQLFHISLSHTQLCHTHTIFHTHSFVTNNFVIHNSFTHTQLCHRQSFTHTQLFHSQSFTHTTLSLTTFHIQLFHTQLCHTQFSHTTLKMIDPPPSPLSFLLSPCHFNHFFWLLDEIDLRGYPVL